MLGLNFFRISFRREEADSAGEREMGVQCWGAGRGQDSSRCFLGWPTSLLAGDLLCLRSAGRPWPQGLVGSQ